MPYGGQVIQPATPRSFEVHSRNEKGEVFGTVQELPAPVLHSVFRMDRSFATVCFLFDFWNVAKASRLRERLKSQGMVVDSSSTANSPTIPAGYPVYGIALNIEAELDHIPVLHDILFAFEAELAGFAGFRFGAESDQIGK